MKLVSIDISLFCLEPTNNELVHSLYTTPVRRILYGIIFWANL